MKLLTYTKDKFDKEYQTICDSGDLPSGTEEFRDWLYSVQAELSIPYFSVLNQSEIPALWEMFNSRASAGDAIDEIESRYQGHDYEY